MRALWVAVGLALSLPADAQPRPEPRVISIHPFVGQRGATLTATVRGSGLAGASAAIIGKAPFRIAVESVETEPESESSGRKKSRIDLVKLRVDVAPDAKPGRYPIRLITHNGISNTLPIHIVELPVLAEPPGDHETRESAIAISKVPAAYAGLLARRGESDYYSFRAEAGQTL